MTNNQPPSHLRPETKKYWTRLCQKYSFEEHHLELLLLWAEGLEMKQDALAQIKAEGQTIPGLQGGIRPHPCVAIAREASKQIAQAIRQLGLDKVGEPMLPLGRPPNATRYADYKGAKPNGEGETERN